MTSSVELDREWLETNGLGGFASSTVSGANTRRYHGLLTAALEPPVKRYVLLSKLEETLFVNGAKFELSTNLYGGGTENPQGYRYLKSFRSEPFPVVSFEAGGITVEKRVFMVHGENTTVIEYEVRTDAPCTIELSALIAFRDFHATTHANAAIDSTVEMLEGVVSIEPYAGLPRLYVAHNATCVVREGDWFYNFYYKREKERGLDSAEDLFHPFTLQYELEAGNHTLVAIASTKTHKWAEASALRESEIRRRQRLAAGPLMAAADQFIVRRGENLHTIIAGYHWFADWGRDAMISLPGLTLTTGRFDIARDILLAFSKVSDRGMLPNRFPDAGEAPEYNTADASLWYFEAIRQYIAYTGDVTFVREKLLPAMTSMIEWHRRGTRFGIHCDADGLLNAGDSGTQLTWMDARVAGTPVTARGGKPVEIQALWYNALMTMESLVGDGSFGELAGQARDSFNRLFWNEAAGCLYDVVSGEDRDASVRPNQVIALSLGYTMVPAERALSVLKVVERELLTGFGLRTLAPSDPRYCPVYKGDASYHQGTVWPWLLGPYVDACRRFGHPAGSWSAKLLEYASTAGLGTIPEIFDGDAPHTPRGCISQAWSVAEVLRSIEHVGDDAGRGFSTPGV